jgi:HPt (histidine-containing phosphotransfer) domain-containing protein
LGELFLEDTLSQLVALRGAVKTGDVHTLERIAHTLKGSCGNIGAVGMSEISAQLQNIGASKNPRHAPDLLRRLEAEFESVG